MPFKAFHCNKLVYITLFLITFLLLSVLSAYAAYSCSLKGDVDYDGSLTTNDVDLVLDMYFGKIAIDLCGDMNDDGAITVSDASLIQQQISQGGDEEENCSDGTQRGQCSATKPKKCILNSQGSLVLVDVCSECGCPAVYGKTLVCQNDGSCRETSEEVTCSAGSIIGDANGDGDITPADASLVTDIYMETIPMPSNICCIDPDGDREVTPQDSLYITNYCMQNGEPTGNVSKKCSDVAKCSDGTLQDQCSVTKPKYCTLDSTGQLVLIDNCQVCGCPAVYGKTLECQNNGSCKDTKECEIDADCPQIQCIRAPCPEYSCINGECIVHTCGNNACEKGETETSCPEDCRNESALIGDINQDRSIDIKDFELLGKEILLEEFINDVDEKVKDINSDGKIDFDDLMAMAKSLDITEETLFCTEASIIGDGNNDGEITSVDALIAFEVYLKLQPSPENICCLDTNGNKEVTPLDALIIFEKYLGIIDITDNPIIGLQCKEAPLLTIDTLYVRDYDIGERVLLTDPPSSIGVTFPLSKTESNVLSKTIPPNEFIYNPNQIQDYFDKFLLSEEKYEGFIIKFKEEPIRVKSNKIEQEAIKNEMEISQMHWFNPLKWFKMFFSLRLEHVTTSVSAHINNVEREHSLAKSDILSVLNKKSFTISDQPSSNELALLNEFDYLFNGIALNITKEQAKEIKKSKYIEEVYPNYEVHALMHDSIPLINADDVWQLDEDGNNCLETEKECLTGKGVKIAIVDTGVDYTHSDFGECPNIGGYDYLYEEEDCSDCADDSAYGEKYFERNFYVEEGKEVEYVTVFGGTFFEFDTDVIVEILEDDVVLTEGKVGLNEFFDKGFCPQRGVDIEIETMYLPVGDYKLKVSVPGADQQHGLWLRSCYKIFRRTNCRVIGGYDVFNHDDDPMDDHYHGTHCAGIAAANGTNIKGVAPEAKILAYKVLCAGGRGPLDVIMEGVERAVEDGADIISMSLGGKGSPDNPLGTAVKNAIDSGVVVVIAAGNAGPLKQTIHCPGCVKEAITVGASKKDDNIAPFSSRGPYMWDSNISYKPDITAPGFKICSTRFDDTHSCSICVDDGHIELSGTSMATPMVAGLAVLMKQAHPEYTPDDIKNHLMYGAVDIGYAYNTQGAGRIDAYKAVFDEINESRILFKGTKIKEGEENEIVQPGEYVSGTFRLLNVGSDAFDVDVTFISGSEYISFIEDSHFFDHITTGKDVDGSFSFKVSEDCPLYEDLLFYVNIRAGDLEFNYDFIYEVIPAYLDGWPKKETGEAFGSPGVADIDGDGDLEVIFAPMNRGKDKGKVYAWHHDGSLVDGWPIVLPISKFPGSPAIADIDGDELPEIIIGDFNDNKVYAWHYDGSPVDGWPTLVFNTVYGTPAIGDIDGDGLPEIVVTDLEDKEDYSRVYAWHHDGSLVDGWPINVESYVYSSPAIADIDGDNLPEIIVNAAKVYAWHHDGSLVDGWPFEEYGSSFSSPVIGDIDGDNQPEIIIVKGIKVYALENDATIMHGWPNSAELEIVGSIALADLNNDNILDIIAETGDPLTSYNNVVYAWTSNGELINGWPADFEGGSPPFMAMPLVADIYGDNGLDIIVSQLFGKMCFLAENGDVQHCMSVSGGPTKSTPVLIDLDQNGLLDMVVGTYKGQFNVFNLSVESESMRVGVFRNNINRDGNSKIIYNKSLIQNNADIEINGTLAIKVQKNIAADTWVDYDTIVGGIEINIPSKDYITLDTIWEENGGFMPTEQGLYRVVAEFTAGNDTEGYVLKDVSSFVVLSSKAKPDLLIRNIKYLREEQQLVFEIKNLGNKESGPFSLSMDIGEEHYEQDFNNLLPDERKSITIDVSDLTPGKYEIIAEVDFREEVDEKYEDNNIMQKSFLIGVSADDGMHIFTETNDDTLSLLLIVANAPNQVESFGMHVLYSGDYLNFIESKLGELIDHFTYFMDHEAYDGLVALGGFDVGGGFSEGSEGSFLTLNFEIEKPFESIEELQLGFDWLVDGLEGWSFYLNEECVLNCGEEK